MDLMTLVARLTLDSSEYEAGVQKSQSLIGKAGSFIAGAAKAYIGVKAVGEIVKFGKQSIAVGRQFDVAMSQVAATMGDKSQESVEYMGKQMTAQEALRETAKKYGRETQFTATQSAEALNYMALAGYDANKSIAMLPNVLNLASAGSMDLARASDMVTDASSALGLSTEETTQLIDKMAMASTQGNTSVEQLGSAMLALGATGRNVAGGTTELAQAFTILADNGIKGSEGGTKLRNILLSIQGKKFDKTFGKLGISAYDASGNLRPMNDILLDMNKAMEGMTTQEKQNLINNTFNRGDLAAVNALLGTSTERWEELGVAIDNAGGAAETMAERQLNNLGGDMLKLNSALEGLQIALYEKVNPALRFFTQFGTQAATVITGLLTGNLMDTIKNKFPSGVSESIERIIGRVKILVNTVKGLFNLLSEIVTKIWTNITSYMKGDAEEAAFSILDVIEGMLSGITDFLFSAMRFIRSMWEGNWGEIVGFLRSVLSWASDFLFDVFSRIREIVAEVLSFISHLWSEYGDSIISSIVFGVKRVWSTIQTIAGIIVDIVQTVIDTVLNFVEPALEIIFALWERYGEQIIQFVTEKWTLMWEIIQAAVELISAIIQRFVDAAMWIWNNWGETILAYTDYLFNTMRNEIETFMKIIRDIINFVTALIKGDWSGAWDAIKSIVSDVWNFIVTWVQNKLNLLAGLISGVWNGIKNTTSSIWNGIKSTISNVLNGIKSTFTNVLGVISNAVSTKFESIRSKIKEKIDAAKEAVSSAINKIKGFFNFSWSLPKLKLPHVSITGSFSLVPPSAPKFGISWYKKAYDNIVEFANPTVIPTLSGLKGFGDGAGSELVMSKNAFFDAIESARGDTQIVFNIYPQKGQSEEEIARAVEKKFIQWNNQKKGAFV